MIISEIVTVIVLLGVIIYQGWQNYDQRKTSEAIINNLLDRIMATDYAQYVQGEIAKEQVKKPMTPEEIYETQRERGIPV